MEATKTCGQNRVYTTVSSKKCYNSTQFTEKGVDEGASEEDEEVPGLLSSLWQQLPVPEPPSPVLQEPVLPNLQRWWSKIFKPYSFQLVLRWLGDHSLILNPVVYEMFFLTVSVLFFKNFNLYHSWYAWIYQESLFFKCRAIILQMK